MSTGIKVSAVGIPWYRRENWDALLRLFDDANVLPPTYDQWLEKATKVRDQMIEQGDFTVEVDIDPREFGRWCRARGKKINAKARNLYASQAAGAEYLKVHGGSGSP